MNLIKQKISEPVLELKRVYYPEVRKTSQRELHCFHIRKADTVGQNYK